jgi:hypothetical protein
MIIVEYTFFSASHGPFSQTDHILAHKASLNIYKKRNNGIKSEIKEYQEKLQKLYKHMEIK